MWQTVVSTKTDRYSFTYLSLPPYLERATLNTSFTLKAASLDKPRERVEWRFHVTLILNHSSWLHCRKEYSSLVGLPTSTS